MPVKVVRNEKHIWQSRFEVDGIKYSFIADLDDEIIEGEPPEWAITFFNDSKMTSWGIGSTEITGDMGARAILVFSGVASAFKKFIADKKPEAFFFTAEEPSRVKLYNRLSKMIVSKFRYKMERGGEKRDEFYSFYK